MRYKVLCGYIRQRWDCGDTVEIEEKHTGKYGARGQTREKKRKATPEEIKKHNQWKRERDVRRLIKWNFRERDYWITLTYPKDYRPTWEEMKDHAGKLVRKMREKYKKQGWTLKYIYRLAIGSRGGRHIHILINRESNEKTATDLIITDLWEQQWGHGHVNFRTTYSEGGYKQLAEYLTKPLEEWEPDEVKRYHPSRNLIRKASPKKFDTKLCSTCIYGTGKKTDMDRCNYLSITGHSRNKGQPEEICSKYEKGKRGRKSGKRKV